MDSHNTVFQAETAAFLLACDLIQDNTKPGDHVTVHTDSQAALLSLDKHKIENKLTKEAIEALNQVGQTRKIQVKWIKAHAGTRENESADKQAKYNANSRRPSEETIKSYNKLKTSVNDVIQIMWSKRWTDSENYR